ncbi:MAG: DUF4286 family protein [Saprospiraceae bacterium]
MLIYNVTVKINTSHAEEWLVWMRNHHIPKVLQTGAFTKCRISRIDITEEDGVSYSIQYDCFSHKDLNHYMMIHAPELQKEHITRYADQFVAFRTVLEIVEELYPKKN